MSTLKSEIIKLREIGKSFTEISSILRCSKSTVTYHLGKDQKTKSRVRGKIRRDLQSTFDKKIENFCYAKSDFHKSKPLKGVTTLKYPFKYKLSGFFKTYPDKLNMRESQTFTKEELLEKTGTICYLTGRELDLTDSTNFSLDHIIPRSKGGPNTLENCGLTCPEANFAKRDLTTEEFFQLCIDVVRHNNLKI